MIFIGTAYPWTVLVLFCLQNLNFSPKALGKVSPYYCQYWVELASCLSSLPWNFPLIETFATVPLVVIFTKFDGQIIQESTQLNDAEDKWDKARENADKTFQGVYLPKVLSTRYPPKAYVRLEGGN